MEKVSLSQFSSPATHPARDESSIPAWASALANRLDELQRHAVRFPDGEILVAILIAQREGWRQGPHALGVIGRVLWIRVDLGLLRELEAGAFRQPDHVLLCQVAA